LVLVAAVAPACEIPDSENIRVSTKLVPISAQQEERGGHISNPHNKKAQSITLCAFDEN
jgi:hypothetical protein